MRSILLATIAGLAVAFRGSPLQAQVRYDGPVITLEPIADGVYVTKFADQMDASMNGNGTVIITDRDVLVIDTQDTPGAAKSVIAAIRRLTDQPVRYVINTHWHGDHTYGNQAYAEAYPGVEFVSHPYTRDDLLGEEKRWLKAWSDSGLPSHIAETEKIRSGGVNSKGVPLTAAQKESLDLQIANLKWLLGQLQTVHITAPTMTVADSMVVRRGDRTIVVRYLGRGNTRGDLTVSIPEQRILVTGDLLVSPVPYGTESFIGEWLTVLTALRATGAATIVPGHGPVQHDFVYLDRMSELLRQVLSQVRVAVDRGLDLEATVAAVRVDSLRAVFTSDNAGLKAGFDEYFLHPAITSAWHEVRGDPPFAPAPVVRKD